MSRFPVSGSQFRASLIFALLALAQPAFSEPGTMKALVEKEWLITANGTLENVSLDGFFLVNNSWQRVLTLETNGKPVYDGQLIKIYYSEAYPPGIREVYARSEVEIAYTPLFPDDAPVPMSPIPAYGPSNYTPEIRAQAESLAIPNSSLETLAALTAWVHDNVRYNISYFGNSIPASDVFIKRQGVCTEYSHLLLAMLSSLGIRSRFVSGYAYQNGTYQPHAWVEAFIAGKPVPADATFGEAGALSAGHIAMFYSDGFLSEGKVDQFFGQNRSEAFDFVNGRGEGDFGLSVNISISPSEEGGFGPAAPISYVFRRETGGLEVTVSNPSSSYALLTYSFFAPPGVYGSESRIIVVPPKGTLTRSYSLNSSTIQEGYIYTIPFLASVQGSELNASVKYASQAAPGATTGTGADAGSGCAPLFIMPALLAAALASKYAF